MARVVPPERFAQLVLAATATFVARGYRLTQMSDVAKALGVAKGTLYGYVSSKEALFDAAVRFADGHGEMPAPSDLPLPTPAAGATVRYIQERLAEEVRELALVRVLSKASTEQHQGDGSGDDLKSILRDLYRRISRNRRALKLIDRCAIDHPELAAVWFKQGRYGQIALLATYLERKIAEGTLRAVPNVQLAARIVLETIALWTIHMPWDASPRSFADGDVEAAVLDLLVNAYGCEGKR